MIGKLPDKDLESFLVETLFTGGLQTLFSILFLFFRVVKYMFERGTLENPIESCATTTVCSTFVSGYLLFWQFTKASHGCVTSEWRKGLFPPIEKVATMADISARRWLQGVLAFITAVCGIFLFSVMSADDTDHQLITTYIIGGLGLGASVAIFFLEAHFSSLLDISIEFLVSRKQNRQNSWRRRGAWHNLLGSYIPHWHVRVFKPARHSSSAERS